MKRGNPVLFKVFSPVMMGKVVRSFDRLTLLILGISWSVTIIVMLCTIYTINLSAHARSEAEKALIAEPSLPLIQRSSVNGKELQVMIERLQRRYPDINILWENNKLSIRGHDGGRYHQWLNAIGQLDTLNPQYHWRIATMCVGSACKNDYMMSMDLVGDKITFEMPQGEDKK